MEDWSASNSKQKRGGLVEKRMDRVQKHLNYLDGSKTHYLSNRDCTDFDTALPSSVVDDFDAHVASTTVADSFAYLKERCSALFKTLFVLILCLNIIKTKLTTVT